MCQASLSIHMREAPSRHGPWLQCLRPHCKFTCVRTHAVSSLYGPCQATRCHRRSYVPRPIMPWIQLGARRVKTAGHKKRAEWKLSAKLSETCWAQRLADCCMVSTRFGWRLGRGFMKVQHVRRAEDAWKSGDCSSSSKSRPWMASSSRSAAVRSGDKL